MNTTVMAGSERELERSSVRELGRMMARIAVELGSRTDPEAREVLTRSLADLGVALGRGWSDPRAPVRRVHLLRPLPRVRRRRERHSRGIRGRHSRGVRAHRWRPSR